MYGPMHDWGLGMPLLGLLMMLAYLVVGVGGFILLTWALLSLSERMPARRARELEALRPAGDAEIPGAEARAEHSRLTARSWPPSGL